MFFDVPHVWGTIYKTYLDKSQLEKHKALYIWIPLITFIVLLILTLADSTLYLLFFVLAFFAVFHFIKQQLWFIMLYAYKEINKSNTSILMDKILAWIITWWPILYWFSNLDTRNYNWFTNDDFIKLPDILFPAIWYISILFWLFYIWYEIFRYKKWEILNIWKYLYILWTFFVWFYWIVWTNSMLIFWLWNMLLHGWNFFAITYYSTKDRINKWLFKTYKIFNFFANKNIFLFILPLFIIWFIEQSTWALFLDNEEFFHYFYNMKLYELFKNINIYVFSITIALLALPQTTHYILDGIIWKKWH